MWYILILKSIHVFDSHREILFKKTSCYALKIQSFCSRHICKFQTIEFVHLYISLCYNYKLFFGESAAGRTFERSKYTIRFCTGVFYWWLSAGSPHYWTLDPQIKWQMLPWRVQSTKTGNDGWCKTWVQNKFIVFILIITKFILECFRYSIQLKTSMWE